MGSVKTTKYEMALIGAGGQVFSLGWTARRTKAALTDAIRGNRDKIVTAVDMPHDPNEGFAWDTENFAWVWRGFAICFNPNTKAR
jgi:hypothetical protein